MGSELDRVMQKYSVPASNMAQGGLAKTLGAMGRGNDSLVAHITPREALMLKYMGGSGTTNPRTGMLEFYDSDGSGNASDSGNPTGGDPGGGNEGGGNENGWGGGDWGANVDFGGPMGGPGQTAAEAEAAAAAANIDADASAGGVTSGSTPAGGWGGGDWGANVDFGGPMSGPVGGTFAGDNAQSGMANVFGNSNFGGGFAGDNAQSGMANVSGDSVTNTASDNSGGYNNAGGNEYGYNTNTGMVDAPVVTTTPVTTTPVTTTPGTTPTPPVVPPPPTVAPTPFQYQPTYGFELNRLMQQYGVSTPTMMPFAGYTTQTTPEDVRRAEYDKNVYQTYANQFSNNMANTNMYNQAQFVPEPAKFTPQYSAPIANPAYAPTNFGGIYDTYTKYFGRNPEEAGVQYWGKMGATGDTLRDAILKGAQNADLEYLRSQYPDLAPAPALAPTPPAPQPGGDGYAYYPSPGGINLDDFTRGARGEGYLLPVTPGTDGKMYTADFGPTSAYGGAVKTRYAEGGGVEDPNTTVVTATPLPPEPAPAPAPVAAPAPAPAPAAPQRSRAENLAALFNQYAPPSGNYTGELAEARRRSQTETEAFSNMIRGMSERGESPTSRAEMYFRLASAFGSPTKTGMFTENLALAGKEMGEYAKGRRADESERRALALKAQEIRMSGAREDLATTRALAAQSDSERRAIARDIVKEELASGRPQSDAGKIAQDRGLTPGTPQYNEFVDNYVRTKIENGDLYRQAMLGIQEANLQLRQAAEARQADKAKELSPTELRMKQESEDSLSASRRALRDIRRALEINDDTFGMDIVGQGQFQALYQAGNQSSRVLNTAEIRNLLSEAAIGRLRESFGSGITNEERRALVELQGALARSPAERRRILDRTLGTLEDSVQREQRRLRDISSGTYRQMQSPSGEGNR